MAPATNGTVLTDFEQHQREVVNTFARAALAMHDAAKVAEEFSNWFARANNIKDIPSPTFNFGSITSSSSDVAVAGKKRKADKEASPSLDQNGKKKRVVKEKKPRDKDAPKRPPSAYLLFQNEVRKEIKNGHPGMTNHEILQEVSKLWNTVSEQEKKTYLKSHNDLKTKYDEEKAAYDAKIGIAPNADEKRKKEEKAKKAKKTTPPPKGDATVRAKPNAPDDSDEGSPKDEEEDEPEQEEGSQPEIEVTEEDEEEDGEEDEDEIEDSEVESESETPKKKAKTDAVHSNSRKRSPPGVKGKEKEKKTTKAKYQEEEKKKKKH